MTVTRLVAVAGLTASVLLLGAPALVLAEPVAEVSVSVRDRALELGTEPASVSTADGRVSMPWDTTAISPGTLFGDTVRLQAVLVDGPGPLRTGGEPVAVPVVSSGTLEWVFTEPGEHTVQVDAEGYLLDGSPVSAQRRYTVDVDIPAVSTPAVDEPPARTLEVEALPQAAPEAVPRAQAQQPTATGRVTLDRGHVDAIAPRLVDGGLRVQVKDGSVVGTTTWREPADVEFRVTTAARTALPAIPALSFLGSAGAQIHLLPQQEQPGIPWIGWSTEELRPADIAGPITWTLTAVDGPGPFGLFTTGSFGAPTVIFNSTDGLPDTHSVALGTHAHANWAFGTPGRYRLDFAVSATRADGSQVSDTDSYTFVVGDGTAATTPDATTPDATGNGRRTPVLASTGPAGVPAATALALALIVTGAVVLVVTRRRPVKESS
ncbi:choice-of-anchor M domain-containing protein [Saccharothrix deserti]|uniref:choice-of-anchor M domain-containing protein n=1 Tax=Saccharothrix deserti TaxID=2593674 RepID=UPI00131B4ADD|nr:choice-of-anchor M domain-containing protein [Saccharothrix deserti]